MRFWVRLLSIMLVLSMAAGFVMAQDDSTEDDAVELPDLPLVSDYTYIIVSGDRLDELAALFDVRLACLRAVNEITSSDSDIIQPGDELLIDLDCPAYDGNLEVQFPRTSAPTGTTASSASSSSSSTTTTSTSGLSPNAGTTYVIQARDTLDTIGQALDVSVISLRRANDLEGNSRIFPGDVLTIPDDAVPYGVTPPSPLDASGIGGGQGGGVDGEIYVVQPRDTLDTIAQAFDISIVQLRRDNNLENSSVILPGLQLIIADEDHRTPYGQFPATIAPFGADGQGGGVDGEVYVVQPRDTFDTIGQLLNISVVQLRRDNGFEDSSVLMPGQQLIVAHEEDRTPYGQFPPLGDPLSGTGDGQGGGVDGEIYVIQPRDTLDTIGQEFNVSVIQLEQINLLENSRIFPGQQLVIPLEEDRTPYGQFPAIIDPLGTGQGGGVDGIAVVVLQPRQTIDGIAQEYNVSNACIIEGNNITNTRNIRPGTQLVIPNGCPPYGGASPRGTSESSEASG